MDRSEEDIRRNVSEDYARAVSEDRGCCCSAEPVPRGVVARIAGYTDEQVASLPAEAVVNSFGCGNPLAFSSVRPGQVVLDLGSGAGIDLLLAARKVGAGGRVIGVDMTEEMLDRARKNVAAAGLSNVELKKGIIEDLPVEDGSVNWVISNCVINLSPQKHRVFAEIARVLEPGGEMLVSDIVAEALPPGLTENRRIYSACLAGAISESAYIQGLEEAGLRDVQVKDRLVYDEDQLVGLIGSELRDETSTCCNPGGVDDDLARKWARLIAGDVASVRVYARKPA